MGINAGDTAWILTSSALVMLMTPGLAFFYGGMVRRKNVLSTIMMSFAIMLLIGVLWVIYGYSISFGPDKGGIIGGLDWFGLVNVGQSPSTVYATTVPHLAFMIYQAMFAIITVALFTGAVVERIRFSSLMVFAILWLTFVYAPVAHWVWGSGGWLGKLGALDFAGGLVVHVNAGVSALALAIVLGPRKGFRERTDGAEQHSDGSAWGGPAVVRMVRIQCWKRAHCRWPCLECVCSHQYRRRGRGPDLDAFVLVSQETVPTGSGYRGCSRPGSGHTGGGVYPTLGGVAHRSGRGAPLISRDVVQSETDGCG